MIRIIKNILYSISWRFFFNTINKIKFINILNNLNTYLRTLNIRELLKILNFLIFDKLSDSSILRPVIYPFEIELKVLVDSIYKKMFLFGFVFTILTNVWFNLFKKIFLLPFKLGVFSFIYSVLGFDVTWFLSWFNFFSLNIPYWVYFQYLTLYNNWLNWWYNTVNIKSITSVPVKEIKEIKETKKIKKNLNKELVEIEIPKNNTVWYIVGVVTVIGGVCFILWYFDVLGSNKPGTGSSSSSNVVSNVVSNIAANTNALSEINTQQLSSSPHQIQITDNQTSVIDPAQEVNNTWSFRSPTSSNVDASSSSATSNPWDGPPSPTGSTDSSETIRNSARPMLILRK